MFQQEGRAGGQASEQASEQASKQASLYKHTHTSDEEVTAMLLYFKWIFFIPFQN
jgi:hypothetical protein